MADIFVEYMVVKRNTSKEVLLRIGLFLAALVIAVLSFLFLFPMIPSCNLAYASPPMLYNTNMSSD